MQGLSPMMPSPKMQITIDEEVPAYRITNKMGFFDPQDVMWPYDSIIYWEGEPNPDMDPINDVAIAAMRTYLEKLEALGASVAKDRGTDYGKLVNAFDARMKLRQLEKLESRSVNAKQENQVLGDKRKENMGAQSIGTSSSITPVMASLTPQNRKQNQATFVRKKAGDVDNG